MMCALHFWQGKHPLEGSPILISIGKFGFFLRHRAIIASVPQVSFDTILPFSKSLVISYWVYAMLCRVLKWKTWQSTKQWKYWKGSMCHDEDENPEQKRRRLNRAVKMKAQWLQRSSNWVLGRSRSGSIRRSRNRTPRSRSKSLRLLLRNEAEGVLENILWLLLLPKCSLLPRSSSFSLIPS